MPYRLIILFLLAGFSAAAQPDLVKPFSDCRVRGSIVVYDLQKKKWTISDETDARATMQPASTFKVINLLIALETGVIKDENEIVKWPGKTDTVLYGYRPEIYHDMTVKEAFEVSAGWVFIELAKKIGRDNYKHYLELCGYGNLDLSEKGDDFWNFGPMGISPVNQVAFLVKVYGNDLPFSKRNLDILKSVMITEKKDNYTIRSKTGWTRIDGNDIGWWVGYVERKDNVYFFATRITKKRSTINPAFGQCRKDITKSILQQLHALD